MCLAKPPIERHHSVSNPETQFITSLCDQITGQTVLHKIKLGQFHTAQAMLESSSQTGEDLATSQALVAVAENEWQHEFQKLIVLTSCLEAVRQFCNVHDNQTSPEIALQCFNNCVENIIQ